MNNLLSIRYATIQDINKIETLNHKMYPEEWHVKSDWFKEIISNHHDSFLIIENNNEIKGIVALIPMLRNKLNDLLTGALSLNDLPRHILDVNQCKEISLYLGSVLVDVNDENRNIYLEELKDAIVTEVINKLKNNINVNGIGAFTIDNIGDKFFMDLSFSHELSLGNRKIHTADPIDIFFLK